MIFETIQMALGSLFSNKLRTILSMLGIVIGVGAVIAIVSIGSGAQNQVTGQIMDLGSNLITIMPGYSRGVGGRIQTSVDDFTLDLAAAMRKTCPAVKNVIPNLQGSGSLIIGQTNLHSTVIGTDPAYQEINKYSPVLGRFFTKDDLDARNNVIVLGAALAEDLFGKANPLGQRIKFNYQEQNYLLTVIGVMEDKGAGLSGDFNSQAYVPITTFMEKITNSKYVSTFIAQAVSAGEATTAVGQLEYFLTQYLGGEDRFNLLSQDQILDTINEVTGTLSLMLAGIAGISLLVGGIGIMNIMLVSVTERTKEIGIRKALGAKGRHILSQFMVEALTLSGFGGLIGIGLGSLGAMGISRLAEWELVIPVSSIIMAVGFALLVGLFFGIYPAMKASRLDPVKALSYE